MSIFNKEDFKNTQWFIIEKLLQVVVAIFIIPKIFNSLNTSNIGQLEFSKATIGILTPFLFLGLSAICIRELIFNPKEKHKIIATTFVLRLLSFCVIFTGLVLYYLTSTESNINTIVLLLSFSYFFKITDVFEFYIQATKQSKLLFIAKSTSLLIITLAQYYGVIKNFDVFYFASIISIDYLVLGIIYSYFLIKTKQLQLHLFTFCKATAINLLKGSFPLLVSNLLISFYLVIDELFLKHYWSDHINGIFATVEFLVIYLSWGIGAAIIFGFYPALAETYNFNKSLYNKRMRYLTSTVIIFGLCIGIFYTLFGDIIIDTFYNKEYEEAKTPLKIFCWAPLFVFVGMLYEKHLVNQDKLMNNIYRFAIGCIANVFLCYLLIPKYNATGAAIAVLISHFITNIGYLFLDRQNFVKIKLMIKNNFDIDR